MVAGLGLVVFALPPDPGHLDPVGALGVAPWAPGALGDRLLARLDPLVLLLAGLGGVGAAGLDLLQRPGDPLPAAGALTHPGRQLVPATVLTEHLVLALVGLGEGVEVPSASVRRCASRWLASRLAFPAILVPSRATVPSETMPSSAANASDSPSRSLNAS